MLQVNVSSDSQIAGMSRVTHSIITSADSCLMPSRITSRPSTISRRFCAGSSTDLGSRTATLSVWTSSQGVNAKHAGLLHETQAIDKRFGNPFKAYFHRGICYRKIGKLEQYRRLRSLPLCENLKLAVLRTVLGD